MANRIFTAAAAALFLTLAASPAAALSPEARREAAEAEARRHRDQRPTIEVAFVLDTTGSMGGLLEGAKQKIWSIASKMAEGKPTPRIRVALVGYKDRGDAYVTKRFDLSEDLDAVYQNLRTFEASGGGDWPEHVGQGLGEAVSMLSWSKDRKAMKMIFVVGDAPPQEYQDGWEYRTWAKRAIAQGIVVNTVRCGDAPDTALAFQELSRLADGSFISIGQTGGLVAVATPYDAEIGALNAAIASKTVYAGGEGARRASRAKARDVGGMSAEAAADRMGFLGKSGGGGLAAPAAPAPVAGAVDLAAEPSAIASFSDDMLDGELRRMDKDERKAHVAKVARERKELEAKAVELAKKRDAWMSKNAKPKADSFDATVMETVKTRAAEHGIAY